MPCPHNEITIVQRSQRQSAVAAAAYQSGEKLFCEYDQQVKHYPEKRGIVHNEILLPANAPRSYADRNTLWNAAEAVEKQWNSQLARRWVDVYKRQVLSSPRPVLPFFLSYRHILHQQIGKKCRFLRRFLCKQLFPFFAQLGNPAFEVLDKLPDRLHQIVGGFDFPVQAADIRLNTTLFHLTDSSPLMDLSLIHILYPRGCTMFRAKKRKRYFLTKE